MLYLILVRISFCIHCISVMDFAKTLDKPLHHCIYNKSPLLHQESNIKSHVSSSHYTVNLISPVLEEQSANSGIMQVLHSNYNKPGDSVGPHVSVFLRFLCRQTELTLLLVCSSVPHSALCSLSLVSPVDFPFTTWGQYEARKATVVGPQGGWALSITKWKFKFNICISLILLNWL